MSHKSHKSWRLLADAEWFGSFVCQGHFCSNDWEILTGFENCNEIRWDFE
jgi:hypothetical protein